MTEEAQFHRLLERVREVMRLKHLSLKTEKSYLYYIRDFILFTQQTPPLQRWECPKSASICRI
ncbi:hypothetical protein myaer87_29670 [Microcystis aeruginosa NIES-87]|uniref:phage integrase N-terminal SAM-like domain-containing protein n=1 Tax=Microcystis TaxID=1125 RepID=UPI000CCB772F|nr:MULTISPECIES: phage integrase N-terminal SAM-like domain-containing protein [Microcystis]WNF15329.1 phage integrase N-terminal SAM-like domain-containing protein [Microcystis aeruginosa NRERC-214]GBE75740.1 hypothetical protein myaer87_29670 [Microcystis aeruginosa NIES-87]